MRRTKEAFARIVDILKENGVPFRISGGFAVRIYGSTRELADIDIEIQKGCMELVSTRASPYIIYGPKRYKDRNWDLPLMTLRIFGQDIDIYEARTVKIYDKKLFRWVPLPTNFNRSVKKRVFGRTVSVMRPNDLISYKSRLGRRVDIKDVRYLKSICKKSSGN